MSSRAPAKGSLDDDGFNPDSDFNFDPSGDGGGPAAAKAEPLPVLSPDRAAAAGQQGATARSSAAAEQKAAVAARRVQHEESIDPNELRRRIKGGSESSEAPGLLVRARASLAERLSAWLPQKLKLAWGGEGQASDGGEAVPPAAWRARLTRCASSVPGCGRVRTAATEHPRVTMAFGLALLLALAGAWRYSRFGLASDEASMEAEVEAKNMASVMNDAETKLEEIVASAKEESSSSGGGRRRSSSASSFASSHGGGRGAAEGGGDASSVAEELAKLRASVEQGQAGVREEVAALRKEVARLRRSLGKDATGVESGGISAASSSSSSAAKQADAPAVVNGDDDEEPSGRRDYGEVRNERAPRNARAAGNRQPRVRGAASGSSSSSSATGSRSSDSSQDGGEAEKKPASRGFGEVYVR